VRQWIRRARAASRPWARGPEPPAPLRHGNGSARPAPGPDAGLSGLVVTGPDSRGSRRWPAPRGIVQAFTAGSLPNTGSRWAMASSTRSSDLRPFARYSVLRSPASSATVILSTLGAITRPSTAAPSRCLSRRRASCSLSVSLDSRRSTPSASRYLSQMIVDGRRCAGACSLASLAPFHRWSSAPCGRNPLTGRLSALYRGDTVERPEFRHGLDGAEVPRRCFMPPL
jgi:hypothetical protein